MKGKARDKYYLKRKASLLGAFILGGLIFVNNTYGFDVNKNSDLLLLVNYKHNISPQYTPRDSVEMAGCVKLSKKSIKLRYATSQAYRQMYSDMLKQGLSLNMVSGYRDYNYQSGLFKRELKSVLSSGYKMPYAEVKAAESVARAGTSEHQTGLAVDISRQSSLSEKFASTKEGRWIAENCYKYGFIVRYNESKKHLTGVKFEPWHIRYVGKPHSNIMYNHSFCLEEYMDYLKANKVVATTDDNGIKYKIYYTNDASLEKENIIDISYNNDGAYILTTLDKGEEKATSTENTQIENTQIDRATMEADTIANTEASTEALTEATTIMEVITNKTIKEPLVESTTEIISRAEGEAEDKKELETEKSATKQLATKQLATKQKINLFERARKEIKKEIKKVK